MTPVTLKQLAEEGRIRRFLMEHTAVSIAAMHLSAASGVAPAFDRPPTPEDLRAALAPRREAGCVRLCHGDLRLQNIALSDDQIVFLNPPAAVGGGVAMDVIEDIAVLLGDLEADLSPA